MTDLTLPQLRHAVSIKERIDALEVELNHLFGKSAVARPATRLARATSVSVPTDGRRGRKRSAAVRARMAAAQRARWANKAKGPVPSPRGASAAPSKKRKRNFSPEALARISAAAKARWAKVKASGKRRLG
jgi:hypothetical protein